MLRQRLTAYTVLGLAGTCLLAVGCGKGDNAAPAIQAEGDSNPEVPTVTLPEDEPDAGDPTSDGPSE